VLRVALRPIRTALGKHSPVSARKPGDKNDNIGCLKRQKMELWGIGSPKLSLNVERLPFRLSVQQENISLLRHPSHIVILVVMERRTF
jgi:hypothetical protein